MGISDEIGKGIDFLKGLGLFAIVVLVFFIAFGVFQWLGNSEGKSTNKELTELVELQVVTIDELRVLEKENVKTIEHLETNFADAIIKNAELSAINDSLDVLIIETRTAYESYIKRLKLEHEAERRKLIEQSNKIIFENFDL